MTARGKQTTSAGETHPYSISNQALEPGASDPSERPETPSQAPASAEVKGERAAFLTAFNGLPISQVSERAALLAVFQ